MTAMEDILDLYARPEDLGHPMVYVDETSKQHLPGNASAAPADAGQTLPI